MPKGGARPGAGAPRKGQSEKTKQLCMGAIITKYGSLEAGLESLLNSGESALIKFVFEHAFGKPTEHVEHEGKVTMLTFKDAE